MSMSNTMFTCADGRNMMYDDIDFGDGGYDPTGGFMQKNARNAWAALRNRGRQERLKAFIRYQDAEAEAKAKAERIRAKSRESSTKHRAKKNVEMAAATTVTPCKPTNPGRPATTYTQRYSIPLPKGNVTSPPATVGAATVHPPTDTIGTYSPSFIINILGQTAANQRTSAMLQAKSEEQLNQLVQGQQQRQAVNAKTDLRLGIQGRLIGKNYQEFKEWQAEINGRLGLEDE